MKRDITTYQVSVFNMLKLFITGNFVLKILNNTYSVYENDIYRVIFQANPGDEFLMSLYQQQTSFTDIILREHVVVFRYYLKKHEYERLLQIKHET